MVSVVITNYKTWDLTVKSLAAIARHPIIGEIIIVDDFSNEEIPREVTTNPIVKVIINSTNLGYARSVNLGIQRSSSAYILLLDSDAYPLENIHLIEDDFNANPLLGIIALKLVDSGGKGTGRFEPEVNKWSLILGQQLYGKLGAFIQNKTDKINVFSCGMAIRRTVFEEVNGFDIAFDFLDADHDFSMKVNRSNYKIAVNNNVIVYHVGGGSPQLTSKRVIRFYKSRFKLLRKHNLLSYPVIIKTLVVTRNLIEFTFLLLFGWLRYDLRTFKDKLYSRFVLITNIYYY